MSIHDETWDRPACIYCHDEIPYGDKGKHLDAKCLVSESMLKLKEIQYELKTQDNRCTREPIFLVQEKRRIYGIDRDYAENWVKMLDGEELSNEDYDELDGDLKEDVKIVGYIDRDEVVETFFTEKAAKEYIERNSHRHYGKLTTYADSLYRNSEMKMIRDYILNLK